MTKLYKFFITITFVFFSAGIANAQATSGSCGENLIWTFDQNINAITISGKSDISTTDRGAICTKTDKKTHKNLFFILKRISFAKN